MKVNDLCENTPLAVEYNDNRYPDMRKFLKLAGYEFNRDHSRLNQGRKDELFTDALVFDTNVGTDKQDSFFARKDGKVLDFNTYTWVNWLDHEDMIRNASNLGIIRVSPTDTGTKLEIDANACRKLGLQLNGEV